MDEKQSKYGCLSEYSDELKRIIQDVKQLRQKKEGKHTNWQEAAEWHMKYSNLHGQPSLALTITLSPTGCEWARKGGCTMCGEFEGSYKREFLLNNPQFHIAQFASAVSNPEVWRTAEREHEPISWIRINQEGNFTNDKETNIKSQEVILRLAKSIRGVRRITIESRPEYLTEETVGFLSNIFKDSDVELEVGMGLEARDNVIRNICINKQGSDDLFIEVVERLRRNNILPLAYVLLKPPFLGEQEAIDEAVDTIHFAVEIGFSRISLEPLSIHCYSLVDALRQANVYHTPWLWSVAEVAKRCPDVSNVLGIGGVGYYPPPSEYAHNYCNSEENCNQSLLLAIKEYNHTRDISVFNRVKCSCINEWKKECRQQMPSLKTRIDEQLDTVEPIIKHYKPISTIGSSSVRYQRIIAGDLQD